MKDPIRKKMKKLLLSPSDKKNRVEIRDSEYIKDLENNFEHWIKIRDTNKKLTKENQDLKQIINSFRDREKSNSDQPTQIPMKIVRFFFIPNVRPDIARKKLGLLSAKLLTKKTEEYGLFRFPELAIRVPRTTKNRGKYETTVLYSIMGIIVLEDYIKKEIEELHNKRPVVSSKEQKEIEKMFTKEELEEMDRYRETPFNKFEIIKAN